MIHLAIFEVRQDLKNNVYPSLITSWPPRQHTQRDMAINDEDDMPVLSLSALAALQSFFVERDTQLDAFQQAQADRQEKQLSMSDFKEDWNASQFWFTDATAEFIATQLLHEAGSTTSIAVVSAPSVFIMLQKILVLSQSD